MNGVKLNCDALEVREVTAALAFANGNPAINVQNSD